jgi:hypothetical protein
MFDDVEALHIQALRESQQRENAESDNAFAQRGCAAQHRETFAV